MINCTNKSAFAAKLDQPSTAAEACPPPLETNAREEADLLVYACKSMNLERLLQLAYGVMAAQRLSAPCPPPACATAPSPAPACESPSAVSEPPAETPSATATENPTAMPHASTGDGNGGNGSAGGPGNGCDGNGSGGNCGR